MAYPGNAERVVADAAEIVRRLRDTPITLAQLKAEYGCAFETLYKAIFSVISKKEYQQIARTRKINGGLPTRFKKGHATWNKGAKGIHLSRATEFKKGNRPPQYRPIGTLLIRHDKSGNDYRFIKIRDDGPVHRRCVPYAWHVWEQAHSPIPQGWLIRHKDGDTLNDELSNLMLIDRAKHLRMTSHKPTVRRRRERNALKSLRNIWKQKRQKRDAEKRLLAKVREQRRREAREDRVHRQAHDENIIKLRGHVTAWYECPACGAESSRFILPCRKCGSIVALERIRQPLELARRRSEEA